MIDSKDSMLIDERIKYAKSLLPPLSYRRYLCLDCNNELIVKLMESEFINCDIIRLSSLNELCRYESDSIDVAISVESFTSWVDPEWVFHELTRVIRPKGCFLLLFDKRLDPSSINGMLLENGKLSYNPVSIRESIRNACRAYDGSTCWDITPDEHRYEDWMSVLSWKCPLTNDDHTIIKHKRLNNVESYMEDYRHRRM